ncbi:MAG TPA: hypothetical protein GXX29_05075 [Firmicutes bacterium]|nr:hypothetical protein [Bacillota bacterium]
MTWGWSAYPTTCFRYQMNVSGFTPKPPVIVRPPVNRCPDRYMEDDDERPDMIDLDEIGGGTFPDNEGKQPFNKAYPENSLRPPQFNKAYPENSANSANTVNSSRRPYGKLRPPDKRPLKIKTQILVADESFQKIGDVEITAPPGVGFDHEKGELNRNIIAEAVGAPVLTPTILKDKLVNEGFVKVRLLVEDCDPNPCPDPRKTITQTVVVPFQSVHDICGIKPGDHIQEFPSVEALLVSAVPGVSSGDGCTTRLRLKAILCIRVIVTRECIVSVPAEVVCCLPGKNTCK